MTLTQIRNRIHALQRRFGLPLTIIRLRPYATQFCHQWATAQDRKEPLPETPVFIRKLADAGFHLTTFMYLHHRLQTHRENNTCPQPSSIIAALIPSPSARKIIDARLPMGPASRPFPDTPPCNPSQFTHALLQPPLSLGYRELIVNLRPLPMGDTLPLRSKPAPDHHQGPRSLIPSGGQTCQHVQAPSTSKASGTAHATSGFRVNR